LALWLSIAVVATGILPAAAAGQSAEERGLAIAEEAERRARGYGDYSAQLTMVLRSRDGKEHRRAMRMQTLEAEDGGDKTLLIFDSPRDLRGTVLLTHAHPDQSDDQWLYLPALKRVKRIAAGNQSDSFMGSEFAYEDISSQEVRKFTHRLLHEEQIDGEECFVIERRPVDSNSGYSRQVVWLDKTEYRPLRIDYFDRDDKPLKSLHMSGYRRYGGRYWRPEEMVMVNRQTGRTTLLLWSAHDYDTGLGSKDFDPRNVERTR
jgi:outer membrane lipoprotein-sorting protein